MPGNPRQTLKMNSRRLLIAASFVGGITLLTAAVGGVLLTDLGRGESETVNVDSSSTASPVATFPSPSSTPVPTTPPLSVSEPQAPAAPLCPTGGVTFSITSGTLVPQAQADGSTRYVAIVGGIARSTADSAIALDSAPGAWGVDAAGGYVIPTTGSWSNGNPNALAPGDAVAWTARSIDYDSATAERVVRWVTNNSGHMVVQWTDGVPVGCSPGVPVADAR